MASVLEVWVGDMAWNLLGRLKRQNAARRKMPACDAVSHVCQVMRTSPYGVHADYIFGGLIAKRNRLREAQLWLDEPSYYSSPRLLQVGAHIPHPHCWVLVPMHTPHSV